MESAVVFKVSKGSEEFRKYAYNPDEPCNKPNDSHWPSYSASQEDPHMYEKASKNPSQGASRVARP